MKKDVVEGIVEEEVGGVEGIEYEVVGGEDGRRVVDVVR